jgi:hypothetical protein
MWLDLPSQTIVFIQVKNKIRNQKLNNTIDITSFAKNENVERATNENLNNVYNPSHKRSS